MRTRFLLLPFLVLGLGLTGCGDRGSVSGKVTVDGAPLSEGLITFVPEAEGPTGYGQVKAGSYTVSTGQQNGLKRGKYKVTVSASTIPESGSNEQAKLLTPPKYARVETSGLGADVNSSSNRFDFDLRSKP